MPTKRRVLKNSAIETCRLRKHQMSNFKYLRSIDTDRSICELCGMYVDVKVKPLPNEIDIGGTAVALNCGDAF